MSVRETGRCALSAAGALPGTGTSTTRAISYARRRVAGSAANVRVRGTTTEDLVAIGHDAGAPLGKTLMPALVSDREERGYCI